MKAARAFWVPDGQEQSEFGDAVEPGYLR